MQNYVYLLAVFLFLLALVYYYFKRAFSYWKHKGVESVPTCVPFGSASKVIRRKLAFGQLLKEVYDQYKAQNFRYVGFYTFTKPSLVILDVELVKQILAVDFQHFTDRGFYVNERNEPLTAHLFGLKGETWKHLRTKLTPAFSPWQTKMMVPTLLQYSNNLQSLLNDAVNHEGVIEMKDVASRYSTDVIGSCCFGLDCNSLKNPESEFRRFGKEIINGGFSTEIVRLLAFFMPEVVSTLGLKVFSKFVTNFTLNLVKNTLEYRIKNNVKRNDFLHLLLQIKNNAAVEDHQVAETLKKQEQPSIAGSLTIEQLAAQVMFFQIAGYDTSSSTLTFCLFELATNLPIQEKLKCEIETVLRKHNNSVTYEALMEMEYMDKCIEETLRKYPPLPELFRECTKKYTVPGSSLTIEEGTKIYIPLMGIHGDPEYYPDPEKFDPDRFSTEMKATRPDFSWLPFGKGPRICIALRFGIIQIKVALTVMLRDYKFTLNKNTPAPLVMAADQTTLGAKGGVWLNIKKCSEK